MRRMARRGNVPGAMLEKPSCFARTGNEVGTNSEQRKSEGARFGI